MIRVCEVCGAELGPWEAASCLSCQGNTPSIWSMKNSDAGVRVLEGEDGPLTIYDMQRGIRREFGKEVLLGSLAFSLSDDLRFCWAGKGLYGLYRHNLVSGPRNIAGIAKFFLYASGAALTIQQLSFVMKYVGYRYQDQSLVNALTYEPTVQWFGQCTCHLPRNDATRANLRYLGFAPTDYLFDGMVTRCQEFILEGLIELERRLNYSEDGKHSL